MKVHNLLLITSCLVTIAHAAQEIKETEIGRISPIPTIDRSKLQTPSPEIPRIPLLPQTPDSKIRFPSSSMIVTPRALAEIKQDDEPADIKQDDEDEVSRQKFASDRQEELARRQRQQARIPSLPGMADSVVLSEAEIKFD